MRISRVVAAAAVVVLVGCFSAACVSVSTAGRPAQPLLKPRPATTPQAVANPTLVPPFPIHGSPVPSGGHTVKFVVSLIPARWVTIGAKAGTNLPLVVTKSKMAMWDSRSQVVHSGDEAWLDVTPMTERGMTERGKVTCIIIMDGRTLLARGQTFKDCRHLEAQVP